MGFDRDFINKVFTSGRDRVNRGIYVKPEELIEISDEDLSYFGEGIFYCLPRNKYVMEHKDEIRRTYKLSPNMPKIDGIYLPTFLKVSSWRRIGKNKPSLKEIIEIAKKENS